MNTARGWVTNSVSAAPVAALRRITEVLRIIREPSRLHLRPTMGLDRLECRLCGTRHTAQVDSRSWREWRRLEMSSPWPRPVLESGWAGLDVGGRLCLGLLGGLSGLLSCLGCALQVLLHLGDQPLE